jgi:hypothetical protein
MEWLSADILLWIITQQSKLGTELFEGHTGSDRSVVTRGERLGFRVLDKGSPGKSPSAVCA